MKILAFLSLSLWSLAAFAFGPPSIQANQDGIQKYNEENYGAAFKDFAKAVGKDAHNPVFHFNLGDAFLKNGEIDKALSEFDSVDKDSKAPEELKYKAMFNAGNAAIQAKQIPKALEYFQKALQYKPNSVETKTNIELALKEQQSGGGGNNDQKDQQNKQDKDDNKQNQGKEGDQKDKEQQQNKSQSQPKDDSQNKPKPFQSQALNENDVRRILDELKRQEEQIRAKQNIDDKKNPEKPIEKDW